MGQGEAMNAVAMHQPSERGAPMTILENEMATFRKELPALLSQAEGKYVLIVGDRVLGTFEAYGDALQAGYVAAGPNPFLVKKITSSEEVAHYTRRLDLSCPA